MAKVLVVDDSRLTRRLIVGALEKAGHECFEAANGLEGVEAFRQFAPDCVLSDLLMPVMDGFEMAEALRALDPTTPIVVATADIQDSSRQRCEAVGVTRLLNKPLKADEIIAAVAVTLAAVADPVEA